MSDILVAPESVLVAPETGLVAPKSVLVAPGTGLVAPKSIYIAPPLILVAPNLNIKQLAVLIFGCTAKISILKQLMKPNGAIEKRPRAWDISERAAHEKKRPSREKMRAAFFHGRPAFSAKQLVLLLRPISQFLNFSIFQSLNLPSVQPKYHSRACNAHARVRSIRDRSFSTLRRAGKWRAGSTAPPRAVGRRRCCTSHTTNEAGRTKAMGPQRCCRPPKQD